MFSIANLGAFSWGGWTGSGEVGQEEAEAKTAVMLRNLGSVHVQKPLELEVLLRILEHAPIGIAVVEGPDYQYRFANSVYRSLPDLDPSRPEPRLDALDHVYATGQPLRLDRLAVAARAGDPRPLWSVMHVPFCQPDGSVETILILAEPLPPETTGPAASG